MSGSGVPQAPNLGLRARNRQRAMHEIQRVALDLFDARGFDAVTVEEVAAMAEVSASTVYRYFGTKDRLVLHDDIDRQLVTGLLAALDEGATLGEAARLVLGTLREMPAGEFRSFARRIRYMLEQPTVAAALSQEARATAAELTAEIAKRRGRAADDLEVRLSAQLLIEVLLISAEAWHRSGFRADYGELLDRTLTAAERGLMH
ncbi:TetR family transcriptional regulator [Cellulomonas denverensis]|uniref:TetR family transcriptional regulator n=1 Tax=Cellulomonas denverensis TaxID=264297 RepID=A0A7X6KTF5_9CELL|nr:TetR family transcriptional regulator [Cellulomonas denverensis]NKY21959.1 TetR family transcriptional regulator [Cellulomonas denverensis]GIG24148.1 mycofactocin system transcriptional regulator [Cellulomonas denverensis]